VAQLTEQIEALIQPILVDLGLELVDLEYRRETHGWVLRFYLDKEGGITLDECAQASREFSAILDVEDIIETAYNLEVSSPGIERPLKKLQDFERFAGQLAKIKIRVAVDPGGNGKPRKTFVGTLNGLDGQKILLTLKDKSAALIKIEFDQIDSANLEFEF